MTTLQELRALGKTFEDTTEGFSCKGTVLEARTIKVDGRAFLFLGNKGEVRLKLGPSLPSARKLAAKKPDAYQVGSGGWMKIALGEDIPDDLLEKWIHESYGLIAGARSKPKTKAKRQKPKSKRKK